MWLSSLLELFLNLLIDISLKLIFQAKRDIGQDLETLEGQKGRQSVFSEDVMNQGADVRFLNMNGQRFLDSEKVGSLDKQ